VRLRPLRRHTQARARDVATFQEFGYHLRALPAFDVLPMTTTWSASP
jgi:hypothetical protein